MSADTTDSSLIPNFKGIDTKYHIIVLLQISFIQQGRKVSSHLLFTENFYHEWALNIIKQPFCIYYVDHTVFFPHSIKVMKYVGLLMVN